MQTNILVVNTLLLIVMFSCTPKIVRTISWQPKTISVDAKVNEHNGSPIADANTKLTFAISNDSTYLYIYLKTNDESIQRQVLMAGMEVWIDTSLKAKETMGIIYPIKREFKPDRSFGPPNMDRPQTKPNPSKMREMFINKQTTMQTIGFYSIPNDEIPINNVYGLNIKMDWDSTKTMCYEALIPFKYMGISFEELDTSAVFSLRVNIKSLQPPSMNFSPSGENGPVGMPPSGGMPPAGAPPGMAGMSSEKTLKTQFKLSRKAG